jgi:hypothetical protein
MPDPMNGPENCRSCLLWRLRGFLRYPETRFLWKGLGSERS